MDWMVPVGVVHCCTLFLCYLDAEIGYRVGTPYRRLCTAIFEKLFLDLGVGKKPFRGVENPKILPIFFLRRPDTYKEYVLQKKGVKRPKNGSKQPKRL